MDCRCYTTKRDVTNVLEYLKDDTISERNLVNLFNAENATKINHLWLYILIV